MRVHIPPPAPPGHRPLYYVIDGRHRTAASVYRGDPETLRCDVLTQTSHALRVIPVVELLIDPSVQFEFAYDDRRARRIATMWDERHIGVLTVTPMNGEGLSARERAAVKLALDRDRRQVRVLESFLAELVAGDPEAVEINAVVTEANFEVGKLRAGRPYHRIESVASLRQIYNRIGRDGLRRVFALNTIWREDEKANTGIWLWALALLVRDGYDDILTPAAYQRLKMAVPAVEIRRAAGRVAVNSSPSGGGRDSSIGRAGAHSFQVAVALRKRAKLRVLPAHSLPGGTAKELR